MFFSTARCSSSRNSLRGIHSPSPVHILHITVLPPALMVFFGSKRSQEAMKSKEKGVMIKKNSLEKKLLKLYLSNDIHSDLNAQPGHQNYIKAQRSHLDRHKASWNQIPIQSLIATWHGSSSHHRQIAYLSTWINTSDSVYRAVRSDRLLFWRYISYGFK